MLNCKDASQRVTEGLDRPLTWRERMGLRLHLMMCGACRRFRRQVVGVERLLRRAPREAVATIDESAEPDPMRLSEDRRAAIKRSLKP